jgi:hypothetical protein
MLMDMSLAPVIAQKRATNFGLAESAAVTYAAVNEGASELAAVPDRCTLDSTNRPAHTITCDRGENQFLQTVSRSFRTNESNNSTGNSESRQFFYPQNPYGFTHNECRGFEDWGGQTAAFNRDTWEWVAASCEPTPARALAWYNDSHPDEWRIDINAYNSLPPHRHY